MDLSSSGFHDSPPANRYSRPLNQGLPRYDPGVRPRLGSLNKGDVPPSKRDKEEPSLIKAVEPVDSEGGPLITRCVIIQRDEKGYGLTVSGDNPVFVQSVKDDGAAARAGVQRGDRIIKVNGTLVTQSNHTEVVQLIKSGSYVALTLLSRSLNNRSASFVGTPNSSPPGHLQSHHSQSHHHSYPPQHGNMNTANRSSITGPHPVDGATQKQLNAARVRTMQQMLETDREYVEKLKSDYAKNPTEKVKNELIAANQRVRQIEETLSHAVGQSNNRALKSPINELPYTCVQDPPPPPPPPRRTCLAHQSSLPTAAPVPPMRVESKQQPLSTSTSCDILNPTSSSSPSFNNQCPLSHSLDNIQKTNSWVPSGPMHSRQRSSPDDILRIQENAKHNHSPDLSRSHSDVVNSSRKMRSADSSSDLETKQHKTAESSASRASSFGAYDSASTDSPRVTPPGTPPPPYSSFEQVENVECIEGDMATSDESPISPTGRLAQMDESAGDRRSGGSDIQSNLGSEVSPLEDSPIRTFGMSGTGISQQHQIISMEDDEYLSDNEITPTPMDDHGPFDDWNKLMQHHGHLSVFIVYLLSNSDPSSVFFYLITKLYEEGNAKEMKKWAYEIHSTFLVPGAPLKVNIDDVTLHKIDNILQKDLDKEDKLRRIFTHARKRARVEVNELLSDFRTKRAMGLGRFFGPSDKSLDEAIHDKNKEMKIIDEYLVKFLEKSFSDDLDAAKDRDSAMASALATIIYKHFLVKSQNATAVVERYPHFVAKDTKSKGIKFLKGNKKAVLAQGHHFNPQHYFNVTYCNHCQLIIWGIGNQGYQCQDCDMNIHKGCIRVVEETCIGARSANKKDKKKDRVAGLVENIIGIGRKPSPNNSSAGDRTRRLPEELSDVNSSLLGVVELSPELGAGDKVVPSSRAEKQPLRRIEPVNENDDKCLNNGRDVTSPQGSSGGGVGKLGSPDASLPSESSKKGASVVRSESLRTRRETKNSFRKRSDPNIPRSNSDVDGDDRSGLNQSGSSSSSSLSTNLDSPSNSLEAVHKPTSLEVSPLTSTPPSALVQQSPVSGIQKKDENDDSDFDVEPDPPNWMDSVDHETVRHLKPKEKKRQDVINELIYTERTHVRNLKVLHRVFYVPMQAEQVLLQDQIQLLFANLEEMIEIHSQLNNKLKAKKKENPIVGDIGDILLQMFDGSSGETFRQAAATFCKNQSLALESLKARQRKDQKLAQFLADASSNPLCRRFQLKDIIPMGMQRLTKYPLLLENLAKYTCPTVAEHANLLRALECSKHILNFVNQAVKEAENYHRLVDFQKKVDRGPFDKFDHPVSHEFRKLDFRKCKMLHEGPLQWRINRQKLVDLHVLLLEDILVLLQKQDEKYVLKYHSTSMVSGRDDTKLTHSPIIRMSNLLTRNVATDKKAFFLVSTSHQGPQIYELVALSSADRKTWLRHIQEATDSYKARESKSKRPEHQPNAPEHREPSDDASDDTFKAPESIENHEGQETPEGGEINDVGEMPELGERSDVTTVLSATSPDAKPDGECQVGPGTVSEDGDDNAASVAGALAASQGGTPPLSNVGTSPSPQRRFQRVEILKIAEGPPLIEPSEVVVSESAVLQTAEPVLSPIEMLRRKEQVIKTALNEKCDLVAEILHITRDKLEQMGDNLGDGEGGKDAKELVASAMIQVNRLAEAINDSLSVTEEDTVSAGAAEGLETGQIAVASYSESASPKPGRKATRMPSVPVNVLVNIKSALSVHLTQLLTLVVERSEERERLRKELRASREQIYQLHDSRRRTPVSQSPSHSRPNSYISLSSSVSEACDGPDQPHEDQALPSTLEAYNKLVNPSLIGELHGVLDDNPAAYSHGEDYFVELFVDAPSESCTDSSPIGGIIGNEILPNPDDHTEQLPHLLPGADEHPPPSPLAAADVETSAKADEECRESVAQAISENVETSDVAAVF